MFGMVTVNVKQRFFALEKQIYRTFLEAVSILLEILPRSIPFRSPILEYICFDPEIKLCACQN